MSMPEKSSPDFAARGAAGFLAIVFTALIANITIASRSTYLEWALSLLCLSLPVTFSWWMHLTEEKVASTKLNIAVGLVGYGAGLGGILLMVMHINGRAAIVLATSGLLVLALDAFRSGRSKKRA